MTTRLLVSLFAVALVQAPATAQQAAPAPAASGVIAGTITSSDPSQPVRKAQVRLITGPQRMTRTTTSDADGRFSFTNLPAGEYTLSASRPGYLDFVYGARRPGPLAPGRPIRLAAEQKIENIVLRLPPGGVIAGVVRDEFGDPALNVPVRALRFGFQNGERVVQAAGSAVTDDLGAFRVAGLLPGEYLVSAAPRDSVASAAAAAEALRERQAQVGGAARGAPEPSATGYVPVYHPGTPTPSGAGIVRLGVSQQLHGIDIRLQVVQTATVAGTIASVDGTPLSGNVQLIDPTMPIPPVGVWFGRTKPDGSFSFPGIVPGSYVLRAHNSPPGTIGVAPPGEFQMSAPVGIGFDERGVRGLALKMQPNASVSGTVALDTITAPLDPAKVRVTLLPISTSADWEMASANGTPDSAGRFVIRGVVPARYRISVTGLPEGWTLASAVFAEKDAADHHLSVETDGKYTDGVLKFTSRIAAVSGMITNASGTAAPDHTVVIIPEDRALWLPQSRRIRVARSDPDGKYMIRGLPPGEYRLAAIEDLEPGQEFDLEFLRQLLIGAVALKIGEGESRTHDLKVR